MSSDSSNSSIGAGNTNTAPNKQPSPAIRWCFTHWSKDLKSEEDTIVKIVPLFKKICKYYNFSIEVGETNKRHLQGYLELKSKQRLSFLKKVIDETTHWEKARGTREENDIYVEKQPIKNFKYDDEGRQYTAEELGLITEDMLFHWQKAIIEIISKLPEKRKIYWYWSKEGNVGKTEFIKYLMYHYKAKFLQGKKTDIMCNIMGKDGKRPITNLYIFGYPRTCEDYVSYDALESVKDGLLFSSKYESNDMIIPVPHILVFANFKPDMKKLSKDRWIIREIESNHIEEDIKIKCVGKHIPKELEEEYKKWAEDCEVF